MPTFWGEKLLFGIVCGELAGGSSEVSTMLPLQNPLSALPDSALVTEHYPERETLRSAEWGNHQDRYNWVYGKLFAFGTSEL